MKKRYFIVRDHPMPSSSFEEGQWWINELDAFAKTATDEQKRAVAVVHHLLLAVKTEATEKKS